MPSQAKQLNWFKSQCKPYLIYISMSYPFQSRIQQTLSYPKK